jgi:CubicO group peptidase (beta-lactamase class C family)
MMRLSERGALRLDDPVSRYLAGFRPGGDSVRLRHLLHQTSGIREEFTLPEYGALISDTTRPNAELLALIEREPLGFAPGAHWSYSNSNYALLGAVIERVTGAPYDRFLAEEHLRPLGLGSLHHCSPLPTAPHHARGYVLDGRRIVPAPLENMDWIRGDGGLCGSAEDLARWARALAAGSVVSADSYRLMTSSERLADGTTPAYGFGLSLVPLDGRVRRVSHGGRMAGFTGALAHYPDHDLTVAVLANRGGLWIEAVEQAITRAVLGLPRPAVRDVPLTPRERRAYPGTYDIGVHGFSVRLSDRDGRLWLEVPPPGPTSRLLHQGEGVFVAELEPDVINLSVGAPDRSGRPARVVLLMGSMRWYGRRVE